MNWSANGNNRSDGGGINATIPGGCMSDSIVIIGIAFSMRHVIFKFSFVCDGIIEVVYDAFSLLQSPMILALVS